MNQAAQQLQERGGRDEVSERIRERDAMIAAIERDPNLTRWQKRRAKARLLNAEREAGAGERFGAGTRGFSLGILSMGGTAVLLIVLALVAWLVLNMFKFI